MEKDPFTKFGAWLAEAEAAELSDPNAMTLATVAASGRPAARIVLLKAWDERGFVFYTNLESRKSMEMGHNAQAALLFHWKSLQRQIRIEGRVSLVSGAQADEYFATRPRGSKLGAWASAQSRPLPSRAVFDEKLEEMEALFPTKVPRPEFWSGWRLAPDYFEFWQGQEFRLHDRNVFKRAGDGWATEILYP